MRIGRSFLQWEDEFAHRVDVDVDEPIHTEENICHQMKVVVLVLKQGQEDAVRGQEKQQ